LTPVKKSGLAFLVPGALDQVTGGYLFDRRIVEGSRRVGRKVDVVELAGAYPAADAAAHTAVAAAFAALPDGSAAVIDGLALPGAETCLADAASRLRLVGFIHHPLALETGLTAAEQAHYADLEARLLPLLRGAICPSADTARALAGYGLLPERIAIVPPGTVKPTTPAPLRSAGGRVRLLCVATVTPRKGHLLLIEALASLADLDWELLCIGSLERDPAEAIALRAAIAQHGLAARVTLAGEWAPERLAEAYQASDAFVLPSFLEGYGMAFAEALAHGLPIVATRGGAIPDTVPESAGLLVPVGDTAALSTALRRLLMEDGLRRMLAAGAARAGAALPDWDETVRRWGEAFDRLIR
jgi:glycosyltransferase involved in cell wall biosynthesis